MERTMSLSRELSYRQSGTSGRIPSVGRAGADEQVAAGVLGTRGLCGESGGLLALSTGLRNRG